MLIWSYKHDIFRNTDAIELLAREAEELRRKLEAERQKLNDIPSEFYKIDLTVCQVFLSLFETSLYLFIRLQFNKLPNALTY